MTEFHFDRSLDNSAQNSRKEITGSNIGRHMSADAAALEGLNVRIGYHSAPYRGPVDFRLISQAMTEKLGVRAEFTRSIKGVSGILKKVNENSALIVNPVMECEFQIYNSLKPNMYPGASSFRNEDRLVRIIGDVEFDLRGLSSLSESPSIGGGRLPAMFRLQSSGILLESAIEGWRGLIGSNVTLQFSDERRESGNSLDLSRLSRSQEYTGRFTAVSGKLVDIKDGKAVIENAVQLCEIRKYYSAYRYPGAKLDFVVNWSELPVKGSKSYELRLDTQMRRADRAAI